MMDSNWQEWRHLQDLPERFEEKGWELGPARYLQVPPLVAEFGPYRIVFRHRETETNESLFEVRQMHDGAEYRVVLVWGMPTPREAQWLLEQHGAGEPAQAPAGEMAVTSVTSGAAEFWGGLLPPVVYAREARP